MQYLIESGREEIRRSQQPFGYYHTQVDVQLDDSADGITVIYTVTQNEVTKLGQVNLQVLGEAERDEKFRELLAENRSNPGRHSTTTPTKPTRRALSRLPARAATSMPPSANTASR